MNFKRKIGAVLIAVGILLAVLSRAIVSLFGNKTVVSATFGGASLNVTQPVSPAEAVKWTWIVVAGGLVICALGIWSWLRGGRGHSG